ncbi:AzlC family ABC transporter permease [Rhizobium sp. PAMB 3182]
MNSREFILGMRGGLPVLASAPFGILFGALATANGVTFGEASLMSATIYAGASQIVGIELFGQHVPAWLVVLSVFAVNFRHILYSAALAPFVRDFGLLQRALTFFLLTDPQFAESLRHYEKTKSLNFTWYLGCGTLIYGQWLIMTMIGAYFGQLIGDPHALGLDVLLPVYFLCLVIGFRKRSRFLPIVGTSAIASTLAFKLVGSPWHVSIGAIAGVAVAALLPIKATPNQHDGQPKAVIE